MFFSFVWTTCQNVRYPSGTRPLTFLQHYHWIIRETANDCFNYFPSTVGNVGFLCLSMSLLLTLFFKQSHSPTVLFVLIVFKICIQLSKNKGYWFCMSNSSKFIPSYFCVAPSRLIEQVTINTIAFIWYREYI